MDLQLPTLRNKNLNKSENELEGEVPLTTATGGVDPSMYEEEQVPQ